MRRALVIAVVFLASCAKAPDKIAAVAMPDEPYHSMTCKQLTQERAREVVWVDGLSKAQTDASTGDALGVILLGVPTSSMMGKDKETELAVEKGKLAAIDRAIVNLKCAG